MKKPLTRSPLYQNLFISFLSFVLTLFLLEVAARIFMPFHAPVLLRDGIYINTLPLVTGVIPPNFVNKLPKGKRLPEKKPAGEIRIFVFGESSVQGLPMDENASAPTMLYDMLVETYPDRQIKVINMGRTSSISANTFYYLLFSRRFDPDFIIFYMGMNDSIGMSGEQCWTVSHPGFHKIWRWSMAKSWLLWSVRVYGPAFLWAFRSGKKPDFKFNWNCATDPFSNWTDILVSKAISMGAKVIVTTPVMSAVVTIEPHTFSNVKAPEKSLSMTDAYKKLLLCRLTKGCDFIVLFKTIVKINNIKEINERNSFFAVQRNIAHDVQAQFNLHVNPHNKVEPWKAAANRYGADFIDFRSALEDASPHRVLADKFFFDVMHLKPEGYYYLARFWFEHIRAQWDGVKPQKPEIPTADNVIKYYDASKITSTPLSLWYLKKGWYLTAIPGLEMISKHCPGGKCDKQADIALDWLRQKVGLESMLHGKLAERAKNFDPAKLLYTSN